MLNLHRRLRPALAGLALGLTMLALPGAASVATADPLPVTQGPPPSDPRSNFKIVNVATGLCITPAGGGTAANTVMVQYFCDADPSRLWDDALRVDGYAELFNINANQCLSPAGASTAAGASIVQYDCDADPARGWALAFVPGVDSSQFHLVDETSGMCVSITSTWINSGLVQNPCDDNDASQRWRFSWADMLRNVHSQLCMDVKTGGVNMAVNQTYCGAPFKLFVDTSGVYIIVDVSDGLCLSPAGGSTDKNAAIVEYYCDSDPSRHWTINWSNGTYTFRNLRSGQCLSPAGGSADPGASIVQYYCDGDPSRLWTLETL